MFNQATANSRGVMGDSIVRIGEYRNESEQRPVLGRVARRWLLTAWGLRAVGKKKASPPP